MSEFLTNNPSVCCFYSHFVCLSLFLPVFSLTGQNWTGAWTTVTPKYFLDLNTQLLLIFDDFFFFYNKCGCVFRGLCKCCGSELESIQLSAEEYQKLKDSVMVNVIQGKDVFNKTTPEVHKHTNTTNKSLFVLTFVPTLIETVSKRDACLYKGINKLIKNVFL